MSRLADIGGYVVLVALGMLLGLAGAFLVPVRMAGRVDGAAVVVAVVGNFGAGFLGRSITGNRVGAALPAAGWFVVAFLAASTQSGGSLIVPGGIPGDSLAGTVALGYLVLGSIAAIVPVAWGSSRRR